MRALLSTVAISGLVLAAACSGDVPVPPSDFFLPIGDAADGREAFIELRCHYCHTVAGDAEMPARIGDTQGPDIGSRQETRGRDTIAMSIVSPSHQMPPLMRESQSPMGNYRRVMTVQQLIDLTAFVTAGGAVEGG